MNVATGGKGTRVLLTGAAYTALFLAGVVQGLIGSFQYSRNAPFGAIVFSVVLLATCLLGAWAMRSVSGALCPAVDRGCFGCFGPADTTNTPSLARRLGEVGATPVQITRLFRTFNANAPAFLAESKAHDASHQ